MEKDKKFKEIKEIMKEIFVKGKTEMGVVWLMFILGIIFGFLLENI